MHTREGDASDNTTQSSTATVLYLSRLTEIVISAEIRVLKPPICKPLTRHPHYCTIVLRSLRLIKQGTCIKVRTCLGDISATTTTAANEKKDRLESALLLFSLQESDHFRRIMRMCIYSESVSSPTAHAFNV